VGSTSRVTIGRDVMIGGHVTILDHDHGWQDAGRPPRWQPLTSAPVTIGDGAWIGEYAFIGKGVTIGEGAIVGAHSVVLKDVAPMAVVAGNPARVIKRRKAPEGITSIIIPTCDGWDNLRQCIRSIEDNTPEVYEIIVIDNGSEKIPRWLAAFPQVKVIRNDTNRGFAAANNQGLAIARGQYLCLLNDDTEVTPGWLTRLIGTLKRYPDCGIVGPMTDYASGPQGVQTGYDIREHWGQSDDTERLVGFCLLLRREVYEQIGPMDERYGLGNFDEDDYEVTARLAGWHLRMVRDVWIHHKGSQTFKRLGIDYDSLLAHNEALFREKWSAREGVLV
jgi:GT2 family glycosyltransferase